MSNEHLDQSGQPQHAWLLRVVLTYLVFLILVFVVYETTAGLGERDLGDRNTWALIVAMALLVLLPVVDRIQEIRISPGGFEARLSQTKAQALEEIAAMEDRGVAQAARAQILQARSAEQVQAALAMAVDLNVTRVVERVKEAIRQKRKVYIRYRPDPRGLEEIYLAAPLDIRPGKTPATRANDYLWVYSYEHGSTVSLRLGSVMGVELSQETFDPAQLTAGWKTSRPEWNIPRDW